MKKGIDSNGSNPLKWDKEQGGKTRNGGGGWGGVVSCLSMCFHSKDMLQMSADGL